MFGNHLYLTQILSLSQYEKIQGAVVRLSNLIRKSISEPYFF